MARRGLTIKQRRFVREYVTTGNATAAALKSYNTVDPCVAGAIAAENLKKPLVREAVRDLLDAEGLDERALGAILVRFLGLNTEDDPRLKKLALQALGMALKLTGAYAVNSRDPVREAQAVSAEDPIEVLATQSRRLIAEHNGSGNGNGKSALTGEKT